MTRREVRVAMGARIRAIRQSKGMGLQTLSCLSDIPEIMIGRMEIGRTRVTLENLFCLARALDVSVMVFFEDDGERRKQPQINADER